jgi:hypothetical protein
MSENAQTARMTDELEIGETDEYANEEWIEEHGRICARCDNAVTVSSRHRYCATCRDEALTERVSRRSRRAMTPEELAKARERERARRRKPNPIHNIMYGHGHRDYRQEVKREVEAGRVQCARCGQPILANQPFDLGHIDGDPSRYAGPEHARAADCPMGGNRATGRRDRRAARELRNGNRSS